MQRLKLHELPEVLTEEIIEILVAMAKEFPKETFDWAEISKVLRTRGQPDQTLRRVEDLNCEEAKQKRSSISPAAKVKLEQAWDRLVQNEQGFYGKMFQPETPEEYKFKYGKYPPDMTKTERSREVVETVKEVDAT